MAIYEVTTDAISPLAPTTFREAQIHERSDLQRLLRDRIDVIAPGCLVLTEEFGDWDESRRRIDLLALDAEANLVVIELKRTEDGGHMELQAVRYASMVSTMTYEQAVRSHQRFLSSMGRDDEDAGANILEHLGWDEPDDDAFAQDVRIVLASAQFSRELTSSVIWLNERGLDIRCVRLIPYADGGRVLLDVQQVIPLPEAEAYQVRVREKSRKERESRRTARDYTKYFVSLGTERHGPLSKRETVFRVVKHLCDLGVDPESIPRLVSFRKANAIWSAPGVFTAEDEFLAALATACESRGRKLDPSRWYTGDDERIERNGVTYVISNQWGGRAIEWLEQVLEAFPDHDIAIEAAD
ncbi:MAG: hypothetical protein CMJ31_14620 [Phycisphaerae bacterium]|nr:hypothetical protein [Phycisphaerae bacterium]|tara:strand:- start:32 stop:1096 length:1065 start_codon:yes stop_codon:yes gene_type:complete